MYVARKLDTNPILIPKKEHYWEEFATFNMSTIKKDSKIIGLYRAISASDKIHHQSQISIIGRAESDNGIDFYNRQKFIEPSEEWDDNGCEDPRVTFFEGRYYTFYTALSRFPFGPEGIKIGVAVSDDLETISEKHLVTPFNSKAMILFPERVNGKVTVMFSYHTDVPPNPAKIVIAQADNIEDLWSEDFWNNWIDKIDENTLDLKRTPYDHIEIGSTPIKTDYGWFLIYSHIQNYYPHPKNLDKIFGVEAILLDKDNLKKMRGRTRGPILVPSEVYEMTGYVPNVIFPSGHILDKDILTIYYGAADTTVCAAQVYFKDLLETVYEDTAPDRMFKRYSGNPIIVPSDEGGGWQSFATFNPASIYLGDKIHILYRAMSKDNTSYIGYASSLDGFNLDQKLEEPIYSPREDFEAKKVPNGNSGCEDPRITKMGDTLYLCYTAYDGINPPRVAISTIKEKDFLDQKWNWSRPVLITPEGFDDKDTCLFPEKFEDGYFIIHRIDGEITGDYLNKIDFNEEIIDRSLKIIGPRTNAWDSLKVGVSSQPIKTDYGWLVLYHGVSKSHSTYRVGAVLLDLKDPAIVLARSTDAIFEPEEEYEKVGIVNNVVFPCGMVIKDDLLFTYYGGGDRVVGVATMKLSVILDSLVRGHKLE